MASATDGSGTTHSSGVAALTLAVDGKRLSGPSPSCAEGPCTAKGEWVISGENYEAGNSTLTVTANDRAGNSATEEIPFTVLPSAHHADPVALAPGSVNPATGDFALTASDAALASFGGDVEVRRSYNSRELAAGAEGPLGAQWSLSVSGEAALRGEPTGLMTLTAATGARVSFTSKGSGEYTSPLGDSNLILTEKAIEGAPAFVLSDAAAGSSTTFTRPSGSNGGVWEPTVQEGVTATNTTTFAYKTVNGVTEPTEALAPVPAGARSALRH